jgi:hypothetical protein
MTDVDGASNLLHKNVDRIENAGAFGARREASYRSCGEPATPIANLA